MRACSEVLTSGICEPGFLGDVFPIGCAIRDYRRNNTND